jgi:diguanylate cyclase (GGDEF)-like protein/putative nucleotidyltransferase with HDIG domain
MSRAAWVYVWSILLLGLGLSALAFDSGSPDSSAWFTWTALTVLATLAVLFRAVFQSKHASDSGTTVYSPVLVFLLAGAILLPPALVVLLVVVPHVIEWIRERWRKTANLPVWYIQPFNIAMYIIVGFAARWVYMTVSASELNDMPMAPLLVTAAVAGTYAFLNAVVIGLVLLLARGVSFRDSGVLNPENMLPDFIMLCLGYVVGIVWELNSWLILPALGPLVLVSRALQVPQLRKEAQTDGKTGLLNARYFSTLFQAELARAERFGRPLAVLMADLDLLRNINNTYGHLAGDTVLAGIGEIIRATVRDYDIAARFGGEEFAIVLPESGPAEARALAERLRNAVANAGFVVTTSPTPIRVTMSLGIACFPEEGTTDTELTHAADCAVYQAKLQGRNCIFAARELPHSATLSDPILTDNGSPPFAAPSPISVSPPVMLPPPSASNGRGLPAIAPAPERAAALPSPPEPPTPPAPSPPGPAPAGARLLALFVGSVIAAGALATALGFAFGPPPDLLAVALFSIVAVFSEFWEIELYGPATTSVSVASVFAAALLTGVSGAAIVCAAIALVHYLRKRPALYKTAFNWAAYLLAGVSVVLITGSRPLPLELPRLVLLLIPTAFAALAQYLVNAGLVATAISLSTGTPVLRTWQTQFQWLATHYLVLGLLGLFLSVGYTAQGIVGVLVFTLPIIMMRFVQQQYVARTKQSMTELKRLIGELAGANNEIVRASKAIRQLNDELFLTLSKMVDARDPYVGGHAAQVSAYATAIAIELGLPPEHVEKVRRAGFLHDIGKIAIAEQVLHKPTRLTPEEYEHVKTHTTIGAELLETSQALRELAPAVRGHHERWDGAGYPDGLREEDIPLEARILAVADAVEAMASDRPYAPGRSLAEVIGELRRCAGGQFDPQVIDVFIQLAEAGGEAFVVNSARDVMQNGRGATWRSNAAQWAANLGQAGSSPPLEALAQGNASRPVAAQPMHPATGRRGRRAEIIPFQRRAVGVQAERGAGEDLGESRGAPVNVAANVVGVVDFETGRREYMTREDARVEAGSKTLDLLLDLLGQVDG